MKRLSFEVLNETKKVSFSKVLVTFLIDVMMLVSLITHISENNDFYESPVINYIRNISFSDLLLIILVSIFVYFLLNFLFVVSNKVNVISNLKLDKKFYLVEFLFIFILWLPIYFICFPGGIFSDTFLSLGQAMGYAPLDNHHPILYTMIIRLIAKILHTSDLTKVCAVYVFLQMLLMELTIVYFSIWLNKRRIKPIYIIISFLFLCFFPYVSLNAITMWKDTAYCLMIVLFTLSLAELCFDINQLNEWKYIAKLIFFGLLVCFFRNNGIYVFLISVIFTILYTLIKKRIFIKFTVLSLLSCIIVIFIQGPVYNRLDLNTSSTVESVGIPAQQIASVIYEDRELTSSQEEILFNICSKQDWKDYYAPCIFDNLKWYAPSFNASYLDEHKVDFLKIWFELLPSNLDLYISSYFMATNSFYNLNYTFGSAAFYTGVWFENQGIVENNVIKDQTGIDLKDYLNRTPLMRESWFILFLLVTMWLALSKNKEYIFAYLPALLSTLTVLIATPVASHFRYIFFLVLLLPLFIIMTLINNQSGKQ